MLVPPSIARLVDSRVYGVSPIVSSSLFSCSFSASRAAEFSSDVTDHDLERAEDTVQELERLGIWPTPL
jgi:hypothetical protein